MNPADAAAAHGLFQMVWPFFAIGGAALAALLLWR